MPERTGRKRCTGNNSCGKCWNWNSKDWIWEEKGLSSSVTVFFQVCNITLPLLILLMIFQVDEALCTLREASFTEPSTQQSEDLPGVHRESVSSAPDEISAELMPVTSTPKESQRETAPPPLNVCLPSISIVVVAGIYLNQTNSSIFFFVQKI